MTPEGWSDELLGDLASLSAAPAKPSGGSRYVIVDMGSVAKDGSLLTHKNTDVAEDLLEVGDLVMPKDDIGGGQIIGKAIHIDTPNRYVLGDHVYRLRLHKGHPPYVRYAINSHQVNSSLRSKVVGSAQLGLGRRSVLEQPIPFPPLAEQRAIAEAVSDADALVESLDALIAKKRDMKQAAMQQLLTGGTRLPGFTDDWQEIRLGELLNYEQPTRYLVQSAEYENVGTTPVLTAGKSFILGYTVETEGVYDKGPTILFDDFTTATQWVDFPFKVKSSACKMLTSRDAAVSLRFVYEMMATISYVPADHMRHWIGIASQWSVPVPRPAEQQAIAEVLSDMDSEIDALVAQREKAELVKQGMMQELLSGRVRLV